MTRMATAGRVTRATAVSAPRHRVANLEQVVRPATDKAVNPSIREGRNDQGRIDHEICDNTSDNGGSSDPARMNIRSEVPNTQCGQYGAGAIAGQYCHCHTARRTERGHLLQAIPATEVQMPRQCRDQTRHQHGRQQQDTRKKPHRGQVDVNGSHGAATNPLDLTAQLLLNNTHNDKGSENSPVTCLDRYGDRGEERGRHTDQYDQHAIGDQPGPLRPQRPPTYRLEQRHAAAPPGAVRTHAVHPHRFAARPVESPLSERPTAIDRYTLR